MKLDDEAKQAVQNLGDSINSTVCQSVQVAETIEHLRKIGYEPHLTLRLEIALERTGAEANLFNYVAEPAENFPENVELELTEEDVRTLQRMKIRF